MRKLSHGHLQIRETVLTTLQTLEDVDVFLFIEGGEPRATFALQRINVEKPEKVLRIRFATPIAPPEYSKDAETILRRLADKGVLFDIDCNRAVDVLDNVQLILQTVEEMVAKTERQRLCVDITTMPKAYFLSLLGWALNSYGLPAIKFVYSPGRYDSGGELKHYFPGTFTEGTWALKPVTYLEGPTSTRDDRALFAFVGADITKAEEIFRRFEPLPKALLYPEALDAPEGERRRIQADLSNFFNVRQEDITFCGRDSAIDALTSLRKAHRAAYKNYGSGGLLFPFATKLSALAAGVFAAFDPSISMFVRVPEKYVAMKVFPDGKLVVAEVLDMTNRHAARLI